MSEVPPFDRVRVDYLVRGNSRISFEMSPHFFELEPHTFQLQVAESDLPTANWTNTGSPVVNTDFVLDPVRRAFGVEPNVFFRIQLTTGLNNVYYSLAAEVFGNLDIWSWRIANEIIRKENLRLSRLKVGVKGWLLKAKRSGTPCPRCLDIFLQEPTDSNCPVCWDTRWLGGYYDPQPLVFYDLNQSQRYFSRDLEGGKGLNNPDSAEAMLVAEPFLSTKDVIVNDTSDIRYSVHSIATRTHIRGVPLLVIANLRKVPFSSVIYTFPIPRS